MTRTLRERRPGGAPPEAVDRGGIDAGGSQGVQPGLDGKGQRVFVGCAHRGLAAPTAPAPGGAASSAVSRRLGAAAPTARMRTGRATNLTVASCWGSDPMNRG